MYPCIDIKLDGILHNISLLKNKCKENNIDFCLVTKMLVGYKKLVEYIIDNADIRIICDSRIKNFSAFSEIDVEKWLIRSPMISEVEDVIRYSDVSFNTELDVIEKLNVEAKKQNKIHRIILVYESGDLRDGCYINELSDIISECLMMENIQIYGIATNLSCVNDTLPDKDNMADFDDTIKKLENHFNRKFKVVSGGASSSIPMLYKNELPESINNLRMGEAVYLGNIPVIDEPFENAKTDNFILKAEIIELKSKPSVPGVKLEETSLIRKRAIVALGKQDVYLPGLKCVDESCTVVGGSSDHIVVDVSDSETQYKVGDIIEFNMSYNCVLNAMNSKFVFKKSFIK
ncbi:MAG: alanine racemase [Clostridia bacterium]|nr:alanine racemase [Clostridia bacterium]